MSEHFDRSVRQERVLLDLLGDKWSILVLGAICDHHGARRFNALARDVPGISQRSLATCLRRLERNGLIHRRVIDGPKLGTEYSFTDLGYTLDPPVTALLAWTKLHTDAVRAAQVTYDAREEAPRDAEA
ncbi:MAG: helix-turn-helix domain-containing protein [Aliidongia sp.]